MLLSFIDGFTFKKIIGYHFSKQVTTNIIIDALNNAYVSQRPQNNVILYTDLGSQYTTQELKQLRSELNIVQSLSRKGCPYNNACIESFHATLKKEEVCQTTFILPLNKREWLYFNT